MKGNVNANINFLLNLQTKGVSFVIMLVIQLKNTLRLINENTRLNQVNLLGVLIREC